MTLIVTFHPTYAFFRNPYEWAGFQIDLRRFRRVIDGTLRPPASQLLTHPRVRDVRALVAEGLPIAVDIETAPEHPAQSWTGKQPQRARLRTVGLGNVNWGLSTLWGENPAVDRAIRVVLADEMIVKVVMNGHWFDLPVLRRYGIKCAPVFDIRDARRAVSSTSQLSLRYLASIYNDTDPWKEKDEGDAKGIVFTSDFEKLKRYNAQDCVETARVHEGLLAEEEWSSPRVQRLYDVHTRLAVIAAKMHKRGVQVDESNRTFMAWCLEREFDEKTARLEALVNVPGFTCSPPMMRAIIYKSAERPGISRFGLPDPIDPGMYTETGLLSVDYGSLLLLFVDPNVDPALKAIISLYWDCESTWKRRSMLVSAKVINNIGRDGRLRPGWNSCGTDTMRFSCSDPNVMQYEQDLRAYLRASEGNRLVHADKSQLELRVMAAVSGDKALAHNLVVGDVYSEDARAWFRLGSIDVKKLKPAARQQSKIIHLASQYAAGLETIYMQALAQDNTIKFQTASLLHSGFKATYSGTVDYWHAEHERVKRTGFSEGRVLQGRREYPREPPITETANYPIQRTAAEIMNLEMIELDERLKSIKGAHLVFQLHDAFDVDCPEEKVPQVVELMQEVCGSREYEIEGRRWVFPTEIKVGTHWSEV